jgi:hypothetical protein
LITQEDLGTGESDTSIKAKADASRISGRKPWDLPVRFLVSFVEALGRSSEYYYMYLPLADEP